MKAAPRSMEGGDLFDALQKGTVTMIVTRATDGNLTQATWKTLRDDRNLFVPKQAALLVQDRLLVALPAARPALQELSGKFSTEKMRRLNAQVDIGHLNPKDVAASFLVESGLR
jgi:osmoprotectant transport system substrate-binding protein